MSDSTIIGTSKAIKSAKDVTIGVSVSASTPEYPARVLVSRSGLSEHTATLGYFNSGDARELAANLIKGADLLDKMPAHKASDTVNGPVVVTKGRRGRPAVATTNSEATALAMLVKAQQEQGEQIDKLLKALAPILK